MSTPIVNTYDQVPYDKKSFSQTYVDNLATAATLFGMQPAGPKCCRVLELGCAAGANLIPMAFYLPESQFIGVDYSKVQIDDGCKVIQSLRLANIELKQLNILEIDETLGQFDYIICHGIFSWVSDEIQEKILSICSKNLAPQGVAYVSYNTYPGWYFWRSVRDLMCYHGERFADPQVRLREVRAMLKMQSLAAASQNTAYGNLLKEKLDLLVSQTDSYLFHDHMEVVNIPVYFHQFMERAVDKGLQYVSDVPFGQAAEFRLPPGWEAVPREKPEDLVALEQYVDFLRNRQFRQTLLCHAQVPLDRTVTPDCVSNFLLASPARRVDTTHELRSDVRESFKTPRGGAFFTDMPLIKAAFEHLGQLWPRAVGFDELRLYALALLAPLTEDDLVEMANNENVLCQALLNAAVNDVLEFRLQEPTGGGELTERPKSHALARSQATSGVALNTKFSHVVELSEFNRKVFLLLDGAHDRKSLVNHLVRQVSDGAINIKFDESPVTDAKQVRQLIEQEVDSNLRNFANFGLLTGT